MPIRPFSVICALVVAAQALALGALVGELAFPWGTLFLSLSVASVTLLAWIGTDGRSPTGVVAGAMALAFLASRSQPDFLAAALAAAATGSVLLFKTKDRPCAESSPR